MIISKVIAFDLSNADINTAAPGVMESFKKNIKKELKRFASFFKGSWKAKDSNADINTDDTGVMESFKKNIIEQLKLFASFFKGTWEAMDFRNCARAKTPGGGSPTPGRLYTRMIGTGK